MDFKNSEVQKEYNRIFIFMLPKPKIWKIRVYGPGPISEIFWDLILPRWIIRIVFYKIVCHIIFRKIFAYLIVSVSNSGLFSFPFFCNGSSRKNCSSFQQRIFICTLTDGEWSSNPEQSPRPLYKTTTSHIISYYTLYERKMRWKKKICN